MKVLLAAINAKYIHSNLGIYSLKTYGEKMLKEWGLAEETKVSLAEYTINHQMEQILQDIYKRKPDVIGFSCYIWNISYVKMILADIKKVLPNVKIWAGGPEVSYDAPQLLVREPEVFGDPERFFVTVCSQNALLYAAELVLPGAGAYFWGRVYLEFV